MGIHCLFLLKIQTVGTRYKADQRLYSWYIVNTILHFLNLLPSSVALQPVLCGT